MNATKGVPPEDFNLEFAFDFPIDSSLIEESSGNRSLALKMMDRIDPGNVVNDQSFGYNERVRHYNRLLSYWIKQFNRLNPDIVIFGGVPHQVHDYILYSVAKRKGVDTIVFRHTSLPNTFYLTESIEDSADLPSDNELKNKEIPQETRSYLENLKSDYSSGKPSYMRNNNLDVGIRSMFQNINTHLIPSSKERIKELILNKNILRWNMHVDMKYDSDKVEESEVSWIQWLAFLVKSRLYLRNLKKNYDQMAVSSSFSNEYIYFPLHYQPERTTSPEGGHYVDQTLVASMLSSISDNILIYIKEHPSQFDPQLKGQLGRKKWQYDDIVSHENVRLVPIDTDPYELIDNAVAVATVTGTAGWEAVNRGTPALVFGSAWYRDAPGVYDIKTYSDLGESIDSIRGLNTWNQEDVEEYVRKILSVGYRGDLNEATTPQTDQVETIYRAINNWISD